MNRTIFAVILALIPYFLFSQEKSFNRFLSDSSMVNAAVSFCVIDADSGKALFEYNSGKSLMQASVMKLITSASALELLGPDHRFRTSIGYTGTMNRRSGKLTGNIIIKGGGDPALGSKNFPEYYDRFSDKWIDEIRKAGVKKITGRVITDDSYFDYLPIPAKWLWEDAGNYYGAGAYGLSVFDNTYEIHFNTSADSTSQIITKITPGECRFEFSNWLVAAGTADNGYVFAAPYSTNGWLSGTIPANLQDFVLKASIADPPLIMARVIDRKLRDAGISVSGTPATARLLQSPVNENITIMDEQVSPPLKDIITVLNHESVNLYAEHLVKELGKVFRSKGSTDTGVEVIKEFLKKTGTGTSGMFIEDGSGLSPVDAINAKGLCSLLLYMKSHGRYFADFLNSLPEAGKEGTLKNYFRDPVFDGRMKAKSGSMTRVRSYAGYLRGISGKDLIFTIIINNYNGPSGHIVSDIEEVLKETIENN